MNWHSLISLDQLADIKQQSFEKNVIIFKHSTRCSISRTTLDRLERNWNAGEMAEVAPYFLDLIAHREVSNQVAEMFDVPHESPQVLVIHKGKSVYDASHFDIDYNEIKKLVKGQPVTN